MILLIENEIEAGYLFEEEIDLCISHGVSTRRSEDGSYWIRQQKVVLPESSMNWLFANIRALQETAFKYAWLSDDGDFALTNGKY